MKNQLDLNNFVRFAHIRLLLWRLSGSKKGQNSIILPNPIKVGSEIGTYCAEKLLGVCTRKKRIFCCFPSKLSRVLHEQGRAQLGMGWGEAENPECRGFTEQEIAHINFDPWTCMKFLLKWPLACVRKLQMSFSGICQETSRR